MSRLLDDVRAAAANLGPGPWKSTKCCRSYAWKGGQYKPAGWTYDISGLLDDGNGECGEFSKQRGEVLARLLNALPEIAEALERLDA